MGGGDLFSVSMTQSRAGLFYNGVYTRSGPTEGAYTRRRRWVSGWRGLIFRQHDSK